MIRQAKSPADSPPVPQIALDHRLRGCNNSLAGKKGSMCFDAFAGVLLRIAMNSMYEVEDRYDGFAADASLEHRIGFIRRVYGHLLGAMLLFVACAALFVNTPSIVAPLFS